MQWCLLEDNNWETVHPNLWTKTIHHGPALYNEEVINYVESHWLRDKSNIDWHLSCLQFQLMFTVVYEAHIFKPFSQSDALRPYERCAKGHRDLRLITWVASFMTFPQQSWHASTSYHSSIFHSPMNSGKAPLTPTSLNEIQQNGSKNRTPIMIICAWKNQRCCFVLSLLNETSEHWIQYANVSHNAWRRELCRLNLATRKKKKNCISNWLHRLNSVRMDCPPWISTMMLGISQDPEQCQGLSLQGWLWPFHICIWKHLDLSYWLLCIKYTTRRAKALLESSLGFSFLSEHSLLSSFQLSPHQAGHYNWSTNTMWRKRTISNQMHC